MISLKYFFLDNHKRPELFCVLNIGEEEKAFPNLNSRKMV